MFGKTLVLLLSFSRMILMENLPLLNTIIIKEEIVPIEKNERIFESKEKNDLCDVDLDNVSTTELCEDLNKVEIDKEILDEEVGRIQFTYVEVKQEIHNDWSETGEFSQDPLTQNSIIESKVGPDQSYSSTREESPTDLQNIENVHCETGIKRFTMVEVQEHYKEDSSRFNTNAVYFNTYKQEIRHIGCNYKTPLKSRHIMMEKKPLKCTKCINVALDIYEVVIHFRKHIQKWYCKNLQLHFPVTHAKSFKEKFKPCSRQTPNINLRYTYSVGHSVSLIPPICTFSNNYECSQCTYSTTRQKHLRDHMSTHSKEKPCKCSHCSYSCTQRADLKKHMSTHSRERPYKCSQCNYSFKLKGTLKRHMLIHSAEKPYKCSLCSFSTKLKGILNRHMLTHSTEKPYKCSECSYSCIERGDLKIHMFTHSGEKPYKCSQCNYSVARSKVLKKHMMTHSGEKPYNCSQCVYSTAKHENLKKHIRIHSGEKPYKCSQCSYSAARPESLKQHMLIHSAEKPYECLQCSFSTKLKGILKRHMLTHSSEKPHKCSHCSYSCIERGDLKIHMFTHSGEKPYKCSQCSYAAARSKVLKKHKMTHSRENPYICSQCSYSTTRPGSLKQHMRIHSEEKLYE